MLFNDLKSWFEYAFYPLMLNGKTVEQRSISFFIVNQIILGIFFILAGILPLASEEEFGGTFAQIENFYIIFNISIKTEIFCALLIFCGTLLIFGRRKFVLFLTGVAPFLYYLLAAYEFYFKENPSTPIFLIWYTLLLCFIITLLIFYPSEEIIDRSRLYRKINGTKK